MLLKILTEYLQLDMTKVAITKKMEHTQLMLAKVRKAKAKKSKALGKGSRKGKKVGKKHKTRRSKTLKKKSRKGKKSKKSKKSRKLKKARGFGKKCWCMLPCKPVIEGSNIVQVCSGGQHGKC